jgi:lysophospholipase L1-like esterase
LGLKRVLPKTIFSNKAGTTKNVLIDSMLIDAFDAEKGKPKEGEAETGESMKNQPVVYFATDGIKFPSEKFEDYKGYQFLISFYEKLYQLETTSKGNVRIAYYGDSMTDGDMIVQDLRTSLQEQFGGTGVGFVPITSESAASRNSVKHEFSENWKMQSYLNVKYPTRPFGVNGHVFFANDTLHGAWVKYKAGKGKFNHQIDNPTVFYGSSSNKKGVLKYLSAKDTLRKKLLAPNLLNTITLANGSINEFKASFVDADSIPVYGFNFDNGNGVHVDNFSQRGNSGIPISKFNVPLMNAFQQKLGYDLIILHYGTNVLNYGTKDYNWYERAMTKTVQRIHECFPGAAVLIISTADKASKYDLEMKTDSAVVPLTIAQKKYAINTQSAFVNLFLLMGGDGSMVKWVEEEPALAGKDYTHPNFKGAKKFAGLIYGQLSKGYEQYKQLRKNRNSQDKLKPADSLIHKTDSTHAQ